MILAARLASLLATILLPATASAGIFRIDNLFGSDSLGELQGIYDFEVAYGARYRLDDRDKPIVADISGGSYDSAGELWRFSEGHLINYYHVPVPWYTLQTSYDFRQRRYLVTGLDNQLGPYKFKASINATEFSPNALDYYVR